MEAGLPFYDFIDHKTSVVSAAILKYVKSTFSNVIRGIVTCVPFYVVLLIMMRSNCFFIKSLAIYKNSVLP